MLIIDFIMKPHRAQRLNILFKSQQISCVSPHPGQSSLDTSEPFWPALTWIDWTGTLPDRYFIAQVTPSVLPPPPPLSTSELPPKTKQQQLLPSQNTFNQIVAINQEAEVCDGVANQCREPGNYILINHYLTTLSFLAFLFYNFFEFDMFLVYFGI